MEKKKLHVTSIDVDLLEKHDTSPSEQIVAANYINKVVRKPWGYEYTIFEDVDFSVWFLCINKKSSTSLHCHPKKNTILVVLEGAIEIENLNNNINVCNGDSVIIEKGVFHKSINKSNSATYLLEIERPNLKGDLVRASDNYGREGEGYETEENFSAAGDILNLAEITELKGYSRHSLPNADIYFYETSVLPSEGLFDIIIPLRAIVTSDVIEDDEIFEPKYKIENMNLNSIIAKYSLIMAIKIKKN